MTHSSVCRPAAALLLSLLFPAALQAQQAGRTAPGQASSGAGEALVGQLVDGRINQTVYSRIPTRRVAVRAWPRQKGAELQLAIVF